MGKSELRQNVGPLKKTSLLPLEPSMPLFSESSPSCTSLVCLAALSGLQLTLADLLSQTYFPILRFQPDALKTLHLSAAELTSDNRSDTGLRGVLVQPLEVRD